MRLFIRGVALARQAEGSGRTESKAEPGRQQNRFAYIAFRQLEGITRLAVKGAAAPGIHRFFLLYRERVEEKFLPEGAVDFCPGFAPDLGFLIFILPKKNAKSSFIRLNIRANVRPSRKVFCFPEQMPTAMSRTLAHLPCMVLARDGSEIYDGLIAYYTGFCFFLLEPESGEMENCWFS